MPSKRRRKWPKCSKAVITKYRRCVNKVKAKNRYYGYAGNPFAICKKSVSNPRHCSVPHMRKRKKGKRGCRFAKVKSGPRKGLCRKYKKRRR